MGLMDRVHTRASSGGTDNVVGSEPDSEKRDPFIIQRFSATGPGEIFNPTNVRMHVQWRDSEASHEPSPKVAVLWRSRDNRKGRNSIAVPRTTSEQSAGRSPTVSPRFTASLGQTCRGVLKLLTSFPYWDMAFWVSFWFNLGSLLWLANSVFSWLPVAFPTSKFPGEQKYAYGLTSFFGVLAFELGAILAFLEAVNDGSFHGSAIRCCIEGDQKERQLLNQKLTTFFRDIAPNSRKKHNNTEPVDPEVGWTFKDRRERKGSLWASPTRRGAMDLGSTEGESREYLRFRWWPTWQNLRHHHVREIGFLACLIQLVGATLFIICGIVDLPGIPDGLHQPWKYNAAYWIPDIVASVLFIPSSLLFTIETQNRWYMPQPRRLGWWIGFWALIGSVGFLISGAMGPATYGHDRVAYHSSLSCLWGSACFMVSSILQQYEAVNKDVVEELVEPDILPHPL